MLAALALALMQGAAAHPFGGIGANRQARLQVSASQVELHYLLDLAEVPTMLAAQEADTDHDGQVSEAEWARYAQRWAQQLAMQLRLSVAGAQLSLRAREQHATLQVDVYGMSSTLRLAARFSAPLRVVPGAALLRYRDDTRADLKGWQEVMLSADGGSTVNRSSVPDHDRSQGLTEVYLPDSRLLPAETSAYAELSFAAPPQSPAPVVPVLAAPAHAPPAVVLPPQTPAAAAPVTSAWRQLRGFFLLGVVHIATGWDHLLFLFGLLLLARSLRDTIKVATAFTLAHSLTLLLAASGTAHLSASLVEPAIGLTIAYVGVANVWRSKAVHGVWLAFGFGLVHGFGFAGALAESLAGGAMPAANWLASIASFNVGIEAFQVLLICLLVPALRWVERHGWGKPALHGCAMAVLCAGLGIFALRLAGG
jgi:hypothetical protein